MATAAVTNGSLGPGQIQFYDNFVPPLHDGAYTVTVSQKVAGASDETFSATQKFAVNGPRFAIDGNLVQACFPPSTHSGRFEEQLPHIVIKKRALPWERYLNSDDPNAPWMGVILLDAGDGAQGTAVLSGDGVGSVSVDAAGAGYEIAPAVSFQGGGGSGARGFATLGATGTVTGIAMTSPGSGYTSAPTVKIGSTSNAVSATVADLLTPGKDARGLPIAAAELTLNPDFDKTTDPCQIIDIPVGVFSMVVPVYDPANDRDELQFSAHVRQVDTQDKASDGTAPANGWFSVMIAKRFPRARGDAPTRQIAHLVSFEGFADRMTGAPNWGGAAMVRLCSLASWTFTCLPDVGETFAQLMRDLVDSEGDSDYLMRPPYRAPTATLEGSAALAQQTLDLGYLPMPYQTRQGEHSFAFYRGPLAPVVPPTFNDDPPPTSPSAAVVYNPDWGIFDLSYAVAFQTGRLMALSGRSFGATLLQWRREGHQLTNMLAARLSPTQVGALAQQKDTTQVRALLRADGVSNTLMTWLVDDLARRTGPKLAATSAPAAAPPQPAFTTDRVADPGSVISAMQATMTDPNMRTLLRSLSGWDGSRFTDTRLRQICEWLAELALLQSIPFNNLVPSAGMLPQGSIRFFYLDRNMIDALVDGALSIATQTSRDTHYVAILRDVIGEAVFAILHQVRQKAMGLTVTQPTSGAGDSTITGFLLRSAVVSGWPGLEVKAYSGVDTSGAMPQGTGPIPLLRMTRLAADILLVLFPAIPAWVQIDEPREGIAFGVEDAEGANRSPVWVRHLVGADVGAQFGTDPVADAVDSTSATDATTGAIDLLKMRSLLAANPGLAAELPLKTYAKGQLSPADFALQMVKLPERMIFQAPS
jgi:hypothetical protein